MKADRDFLTLRPPWGGVSHSHQSPQQGRDDLSRQWRGAGPFPSGAGGLGSCSQEPPTGGTGGGQSLGQPVRRQQRAGMTGEDGAARRPSGLAERGTRGQDARRGRGNSQ